MGNFSLLSLLRSLDDFGHKINVTYKGEEAYQTCGGSLLSVEPSTRTSSVRKWSRPHCTSWNEEIGLFSLENKKRSKHIWLNNPYALFDSGKPCYMF